MWHCAMHRDFHHQQHTREIKNLTSDISQTHAILHIRHTFHSVKN
uniref:Uncharacterized protein n=1 Tax=Anguilla anguilla TaxID=7936 RepID=A0A0E9U781_ANGAN